MVLIKLSYEVIFSEVEFIQIMSSGDKNEQQLKKMWKKTNVTLMSLLMPIISISVPFILW